MGTMLAAGWADRSGSLLPAEQGPSQACATTVLNAIRNFLKHRPSDEEQRSRNAASQLTSFPGPSPKGVVARIRQWSKVAK